MSRNSDKLSRNQELAIAALLRRRTIAAAAKDIGVAVSTLKTWLKKPVFAEAYAAARRESLRQTILDMQAGSRLAVKTLRKLLSNPDPRIQLGAADAYLKHVFKGADVFDIQQQLREIIERLKRAGDAGAT